MKGKLFQNTQNSQMQLLNFFPAHYCEKPSDYITFNLVDLTQNFCNHLIDDIAKSLSYPKTLQHSKLSATKYFFLISNLSAVSVFANTWVTKQPIRIVICDPVKKSSKLLQDTFKTLWKNKFLKVLIVFVENYLRIVNYNPFENRIVELKNSHLSNCFDNKIKDINGYVFKVAMIINPPQTIKVNDEWISKDFSLLKFIIEALNATLEIIEVPQIQDYGGVIKFLLDEKAECTFVGLIQGNDNEELDYFNSHIADGFVALTPKSSQQIITIFTAFDIEVWVYLAFTILILFALIALFKKYYLSGKFRFLDLMSLTILTVLLTMFQSGISSTLAKVKYQQDIHTMDDLLKSGLPVFGFSRSKVIIETLAGYKLQSHITNKSVLYKMVTDGYSDRVYILPLFVALEFEQMKKNDRYLYSIMKEPLFPSFRIFLFRKNSPFLEEVANTVLLLRQAGLIPKLYDQNQSTKQKEDTQVVFLKLSHLSSVFGLLLIGLLISVICFCCEILKKKILKIILKQKKKYNVLVSLLSWK